MASGGTERSRNPARSGSPRSRTSVVIDQLLARGPWLAPSSVTDAGPWTTVAAVLRRTAPSALAGHLSWLASRVAPDDHGSAHRVLAEDQIRIIVRALDEGGQHEAVSGALEQPWDPVTVVDGEDDLVAYASDVAVATSAEPAGSPATALADSAAEFAAAVVAFRAASARRRSA